MSSRTGILKMFARSPVKPLQQHMGQAHHCAELLMPFLDAMIHKNWKQAADYHQQIITAERKADQLKMDLRLHLRGLLLPAPRNDLLAVLKKQEVIANMAKDIAGIIFGRKMAIPEQLAAHFSDYLKRCVDASAQAKAVIAELDELLESGFRGREVKHVDSMIKALDNIEYDTDQLQIDLRAALFAIEDELKPIDVMFLYKIIEWMGQLADSAQEVGNRLRVLSAE